MKQKAEYLTVSGLSKTFHSGGQELEVLRDINLSICQGEILCIVGASGCGKSTLLRAIAGIDAEHTGSVVIDGKTITHPDKKIGFVFQEHRLFPWLTVEQNIAYALNEGTKKEKEIQTRKYLELVGLEKFAAALPRELSGGMAQRAGIARALVNEPPVLLLDEPFGALDTFTKITMQNELKRIQRESKTTMVMVTHDIDEAVYLSDHIAVFSSRPGTVKDFFRVELAEPRDRNEHEFLRIRRKVFDEFFERIDVHEEYNI
ncbi:MAG: ABC transporter ATP-binding protein [Eubacteriales bacterium]|nr:ABC transporter ATP-binding protein [Eubacteriales bacterium]